MSNLAGLIAFLLKLMVGDSRATRSTLRNLILALIVLGISCALVFSGFGFIIWAFYLYSTSFFKPPISALITGLVILLTAAALLLGTKLLTAYILEKKREQARLCGTGSGVMAEGLSLIRDYPGETLLSALAAGLLVGISSGVRRVFTVLIVWLFTQNPTGKNLE